MESGGGIWGWAGEGVGEELGKGWEGLLRTLLRSTYFERAF